MPTFDSLTAAIEAHSPIDIVFPLECRRFEIAPSIDPQVNVSEGGGRQVLPLAGQLLDQLFEPRIVSDDHHRLGVL